MSGKALAPVRHDHAAHHGSPGLAAAITLRLARPDDAVRIAEIWNHEVLHAVTTTDTEPRSPDQQRTWLADRTQDHPVVVAVSGRGTDRAQTGRPVHGLSADEVVAYGALSPYRVKAAFRHSVEDSVYVERGRRGAGLGHLIVGRLMELARERGHHTVIARITTVNAASLRLHERHGFRLVGVEREIAFKMGRWLDVAIMQRVL
jgi:L-amino acid N-acyltransferase